MPPEIFSSWVRIWSSWPPLLVRRLRAKVALMSAQRVASAGVRVQGSLSGLALGWCGDLGPHHVHVRNAVF